LSSVYAAQRADVLLMSEPFDPKAARDAPTLHLATEQSGPPTAVVVSGHGGVPVPAKVDVSAPPTQMSASGSGSGSGSGSRRKEEFAKSSTLVSSSSSLDLEPLPARAAAVARSSGGRVLLAIAVAFVAAILAFTLLSRRKAPLVPVATPVHAPTAEAAKGLSPPAPREVTVQQGTPNPEVPPAVASAPEASSTAPLTSAEHPVTPRPNVPVRPRPGRPAPPPPQVKPATPSDIRLER
jgi:hypothetical protein